MTKAFQIYPSHWVAPFKYVEVFFTLSLGLFVFSETYTLLSFLGTFLIIFGLVLHVVYKQKKA
jgi:drug/metabolite transporter (DMT)-like permease